MVNALNRNHELEGLPRMLGYKVTKDCSEILMTYGGNTLVQWRNFIEPPTRKFDFAADLLRQGIKALKTLHKVGYSHGDLKSENICARMTREGGYKFTLIDFGICSKLVDETNDYQHSYFRGNLMFCSHRQLNFMKPTRLCDLISLAKVAYALCFGAVPDILLARKM
jgi:serine/threonine protein kinase